ncbi:MAG: NAD(P)-dependent glycerol-3-phosphate dehydrogenase [Candidatus Omnitrophica bacterium]|nr:NAD(P)-dependent glycerol-3-phosphate dehydrogenase [Candidatus Omnitrophota bacterium]
MKIAIIGDGGWGTALAIMLSTKKYRISVWSVDPGYAAVLNAKRENLKFLPGVAIPPGVDFSGDLEQVLRDKDMVILAVPSMYMRDVLKKIKQYPLGNRNFLSVTKGFECATTQRMSEVIREELGMVRLAVLSGPNIAFEVARGVPSAAVCASHNVSVAAAVQEALMTPVFRVYTSSDVLGVELAGSLKNIIAIGCGISDGLGFGTNTKAALLTRGLAEISRLGVSLGGRYKTFSGLSGMGDLVTTCLSSKSRNRWLGEELGKGKKMRQILASTEMVIEGVSAAKTALKIAKRQDVVMPITQEVYRVMFRNKSPVAALRSLMLREKKKEI